MIPVNLMYRIHKMDIWFWRYSNFAERAVKPAHSILNAIST